MLYDMLDELCGANIVRINDLNKRGVNCLKKVFSQILAKNED